MADPDPFFAQEQMFNVNSEVIGLTPSVATAHSMLALAGSWGREQAAASNQFQLNAMSAMVELVREYSERGKRSSPLATEALDLVRQVVAAAQAP
jgi:hypothetical protein